MKSVVVRGRTTGCILVNLVGRVRPAVMLTSE